MSFHNSDHSQKLGFFDHLQGVAIGDHLIGFASSSGLLHDSGKSVIRHDEDFSAFGDVFHHAHSGFRCITSYHAVWQRQADVKDDYHSVRRGGRGLICRFRPSVQKVHELTLADDADFSACIYQFLGSPVFAAFCVAGKLREILIADDEQGCSGSDRVFDADPAAGGILCCLLTRHCKGASEDRSLPGQRTICDTFDLHLGTLHFLWCGSRQILEGYFRSLFGCEHNLGRGGGIFSGVMVVELKIQNGFEVGEAMPTISTKLRPSTPRDAHAVQPLDTGRVDTAVTAGSFDGALVKSAVLYNWLFDEKRRDMLEGLLESGPFTDCLGVDSMDARIKRVKGSARIDQGAEHFDLVVLVNKGQTNLANTSRVGVRGFDIQSNKPKSVFACRDRHRRGHRPCGCAEYHTYEFHLRYAPVLRTADRRDASLLSIAMKPLSLLSLVLGQQSMEVVQ